MKKNYLRRTAAAAAALVIIGGILPATVSSYIPINAYAEESNGSVVLKNGVLTLSGHVAYGEIQKYADNEKVTSIVANRGTVLPESCAGLFDGLTEVYGGLSYEQHFINVKSIDLHLADASNVTTMRRMFNHLEKLESLDLSGMDFRNATKMDYLFNGCFNLTSLNLKGLDMSGVITAELMFGSCKSLTSLDLSGLDFSNVQVRDSMFFNCTNLEVLDLGDRFPFSDVSSIDSMFKNCSKLKTILTRTDESKYPDLHYTDKATGVFDGCDSLVGGYGTTRFNLMYEAKYARADIPDAPGYFTYDCGSFDSLSLKLTLDGPISKTALDKYRNNPRVWYIVADATASLPDSCFDLFADFKAAFDIDLSAVECDNVDVIMQMFFGCTSLKTIDISGMDLSVIENAQIAFKACRNLKTIYVSSEYGKGSLTHLNPTYNNSIFSGCTSLVGGAGTVYSPDNTGTDYARIDGRDNKKGYFSSHSNGIDYDSNTDTLYISCEFTKDDIEQYKSTAKYIITKKGAVMPDYCNELFRSFPNLIAADLTKADFSNTISMRGMFRDSAKLTEVLWGFNAQTGNVENMQNLFCNCSALEYPHVEQLNTSSVPSLYRMFYGCSSLKNLDLSGFDMSNVTTMNDMFYGCTSLDKLDLSKLDTSSVDSMSGTFRNCSALTTIIVGDGWNTANVRSSANMFNGCTSLVGGIGTKYSSSKTDKTYARIDTVSEPGYLTANHPVFISNSMTLGGSIGLNFYVAPSGIYAADLPKTYVVFDVNGKQQKVDIDLNKMNGKKTGYGFNCRLNSVSMADNVKATLHYFDQYGNEKIYKKTANCEQYLRKFNEELDGGTKSWELIKGINDYGYYMQKYLSSLKTTNWVLGVDHRAMELAFRNHAYFNSKKASYIDDIKDQAKSFGTNKNIKKVNYSLVLDSDTAINFKIRKVDGYTGKFTVTVDGKSVTPKKLTDGRFQVSVTGIPAHKLNEVHTVKVTTDSGTTTYKASAISYLYECISKPNSDLEFDAMCAMYEYYKAAVAFKA